MEGLYSIYSEVSAKCDCHFLNLSGRRIGSSSTKPGLESFRLLVEPKKRNCYWTVGMDDNDFSTVKILKM